MQDDVAVVGGQVLTGLADLTDDLGALDSRGLWAVMVPFSGRPVCARFTRRTPLAGRDRADGPGWRGPAADSWSSSIDRAGFSARVAVIRESIAAGDVYQVNLCRRLSAPWPPGADIAGLAAVLADRHPAPHAALLHLPSAGVHVASASPERFLRRDAAMVESRPIKGTAARAGAFLPKDRAENVMIVDLVRNDLGRVCEFGTVEVDGLCEVEAHPGLVHLVSTVRGRLRAGVGWAELLAATFPPGSVTGAPKCAALGMIGRLEPVSRRRVLRRAGVGRRRLPAGRSQRRHPHVLAGGRPTLLRHRRGHHLGFVGRRRMGGDRAQGRPPGERGQRGRSPVRAVGPPR